MLTRIFSNLRLRPRADHSGDAAVTGAASCRSPRSARPGDRGGDPGSAPASLAAADQGRQIESTQQLLTILARLPEVRSGDESCDTLLADLLTQFPRYLNIGVIAADGMLSCSGLPVDGELFGDRAYFQQAVSTKDFAVGEYQIGRVTDKPALNCGYPIVDAGGTVVGVVYAAIDLNSLVQFAAQAKLPRGSVLTVATGRAGSWCVCPNRPTSSACPWSAPGRRHHPARGNGVTGASDNGETFVFAFESLRSAQPAPLLSASPCPRRKLWRPLRMRLATT